MMATPTAISLVFVMMYHPTLGVMNYLVTLIGLPPFKWTYSSALALSPWPWWMSGNGRPSSC